MLAPSLLPAFSDIDVTQVPVVVVTSAVLLQALAPKNSKNTSGFAVSARGWTEKCGTVTNSSGTCAHIVVVNRERRSAAMFALRVRLPSAPSHLHERTPGGTNDTTMAANYYPTVASRLFVNGGYNVSVECRPGTNCTEGELTDWIGASETVVYEIGCNGPAAWSLNRTVPYGVAATVAAPLPPRRRTSEVALPPAWPSCASRRVQCVNNEWGGCS